MAKISPGTMTAVIFAILIGLAGAYGVRHYLHQPSPQQVGLELPAAGPGLIYVPVAATDLAHGHVMTINDIAILKFTPEEFKKSKYGAQAYMPETSQIAARMLKAEVKRGDSFSPERFYADGMAPGVVEDLEAGQRAVTVIIKNAGAVQGFARPGNLVDVLFRSEPEGERPAVTLTLLEMVRVLAVNATTQQGRAIELGLTGESEGTVTLAVTPDQAKLLKAVEGRGDLTLTLRSDDDPEHMFQIDSEMPVHRLNMNRITLDHILGMPSKKPAETMEIYKAGQKQVVTFQKDQPGYDPTNPLNMIQTPMIGKPVDNRVVGGEAPAMPTVPTRSPIPGT